eukprot:4287549-Ditylum_brightwellii.AAC.1
MFQTTSVNNFNSLIVSWHHNVLLGAQPHPDYKTFLTKVQEHYKDMVVNSKWNSTSNQGTAFTAKTSPQTTATPLPSAATLTPHRRENDISMAEIISNQIVQKDKKVQADLPCFEKIINGNTQTSCEKCGHGTQLGCWTTTHYANEHCGKCDCPQATQPQTGIATSDSVETITSNGTHSVSFSNALMLAQAR